MTLTRLLPAAAGAVLTAMLVIVPAAPAQAATANISISGPAPGSQLTSTSVAVTGSANIDPGLLGNNAITDLNVAVTFENAPFDSCDDAGCGAATGHASTNFSFSPKALSRNGPYGVTANVTANEYVLGSSLGPSARTGSASTNFSVGIPPAAPRNVKAQVNSDNSVTVSWSANPEPDLIGYQIQRQDSASSGPHVVNSFLTSTSWTDTTTAAAGGNFGYTVIAFRPGADGTATASTVMHTSSAVASASVAAPIPVTTTLAPGAGTQNTTTTQPTISVPAGSVDLSGFLAQATKAGAIPTPPPAAPVSSTSPPPKVVVPASASSESLPALSPPDTYAPTLPYGSPPAATASTAPPASRGVPRVALPGRPAASHQHRSLLFSIAGGLLLCVVGLVVRVANHRPDHLPLEPVTGEDLDDPVARPSGRAARSLRTTDRSAALARVVARRDEMTLAGASVLPAGAAGDEDGRHPPVPAWRMVGASGVERPGRVEDAARPEEAVAVVPDQGVSPYQAVVADEAVAPDQARAPDQAGAPERGDAAYQAVTPDGAGDPEQAGAPDEAVTTQGAREQPEAAQPARARAGAQPAPPGLRSDRGDRGDRSDGSRRSRRSGRMPPPTLGEPGDYFRFILGDEPAAGAEPVEVTAPAG